MNASKSIMTISMTAPHLHALQAVAKLAKGDSRDMLTCVCFDTLNDGGRAVASNGHTLVTAPIQVTGRQWIDTEQRESLLLDLNSVRLPKTEGVTVHFEIDMDAASALTQEITLRYSNGKVFLVPRMTAARYVDWQRATQASRNGVDAPATAVSLNPAYLVVVAKSLPRDCYPTLRFKTNGGTEITQIKVEWNHNTGKELFHIVMPCRF